MIDSHIPSREKSFWTVLGACACAFLLTLTVACGGGVDESTEPPPADESAATEAPVDEPAAATGPTGTASVTGSVAYTGSVPNLKPINMNADPACQAKHDSPVPPEMLVLGDGQSLGNVFVRVSAGAPEGSYAAPSEPVVIDQNGCIYDPHVVGMIAGQELKFLNSDGILHNVHGLPEENREFNIGMPANVTEKGVELNRPENMFPVKCDVHPWMNAYVAVMTHPFWDVTAEDGRFSIENLPAGTYTIEAWHERLGIETAEVTVGDGESASTDFSFSAPSG